MARATARRLPLLVATAMCLRAAAAQKQPGDFADMLRAIHGPAAPRPPAALPPQVRPGRPMDSAAEGLQGLADMPPPLPRLGGMASQPLPKWDSAGSSQGDSGPSIDSVLRGAQGLQSLADILQGRKPPPGAPSRQGGLPDLPSALGSAGASLGDALQGLRMAEAASGVVDRLSGCCRAMTAKCMACATGQSVEQFCAMASVGVPGCDEVEGGGPEEAHGDICAGVHGRGFAAGEHVSDPRGEGIVACESSRQKSIVGVCGAAHTGHDRYNACSGSSRRPQHCAPRSLYFYNCAQVKPTWVRPEPASQPIDCGCSWSSLSGCRVSGEQLLAGLEALPGANPGCAGGGDAQHHEECALRQSMASTAGKYKHCFALDAPACAASPLCSWGEQSQGECGVNELHLLQTLAGPKLSKNPIIQAALQAVTCQKFNEQSCSLHHTCAWVTMEGASMCDVAPAIAVKTVIRYPQVVIDLPRATMDAVCRAQHEAKHGYQAECDSSACRMEGTFCTLDESKYESPPIHEAMETMCQQAQSLQRTCPSPCRMKDSVCSAPAFGVRTPTHSKERDLIVKVLSLAASASVLYEERCRAPERGSRMACQATAPVCDATAHDFAGGSSSAWARPRDVSPGPGFRGVLGRAAQAFAAGRADQFLTEYLENHPEDVGNLTMQAWDSLSSLFRRAETTTTPPPPAPAMVVSDAGEVFELDRANVTDAAKIARIARAAPLLVAAGAVVVAGVCAGVAFGALCHARLSRAQAREPLLDGATKAWEPPMLREQELEQSALNAAASGTPI